MFDGSLLRYEKQIKLAGIIYLQRITDNRMAGTPHHNLRMFRELCGNRAMKKVVLVTTSWDKASGLEKDLQTFLRREQQLIDNHWKIMIDHGASTARFSNSVDSAWNIIDIILKQQESEVLLLQEEIVDLKRALNETQIGKIIYSDLLRFLADQRDTLRSLAQQAREDSNPQLARQLESELQRIQKDFDKTFNDMNNLKIPLLLFGNLKKSRGVRLLI